MRDRWVEDVVSFNSHRLEVQCCTSFLLLSADTSRQETASRKAREKRSRSEWMKKRQLERWMVLVLGTHSAGGTLSVERGVTTV